MLFIKGGHVGRAVADRLPDESFRTLADQFRGELARVAAAERGELSEEIFVTWGHASYYTC